ncbi:MAG: hypothetical protein AAF939_13490 [Planctomycetota bacterium]
MPIAFLLPGKRPGINLGLLSLLFWVALVHSAVGQTEPKISDYRKDMKMFLKHSKGADETEERVAIYNLCTLHQQIVTDSRFSTHPGLQSYRYTISQRLKDYIHDHEKRGLKDLRNRRPDHQRIDSIKGIGHAKSEFEDSEKLVSSSQPNQNELVIQIRLNAAFAHHLNGMLSGGPNEIYRFTGGQHAPPWDHGFELVELIENTIDPASWRRNGGEGNIEYYRPSRVIVVSSTEEVNGQVEELFRKLRAANGVQITNTVTW